MEVMTPINCVQPPQRPLPQTEGIENAMDPKKVKVAKDFESVLLSKVFDEMRNTVPESGLVEDETSGQMQGIFWMYLSQDVSEKGGMGLWKEIYQQINKTDNAGSVMDTKL
jgi:Rod binding domain-containing protein